MFPANDTRFNRSSVSTHCCPFETIPLLLALADTFSETRLRETLSAYGWAWSAYSSASVQPVCKIPILESMRRDAGPKVAAGRRYTVYRLWRTVDDSVGNGPRRKKRTAEKRRERVSCVKSARIDERIYDDDGYDESKSDSHWTELRKDAWTERNREAERERGVGGGRGGGGGGGGKGGVGDGSQASCVVVVVVPAAAAAVTVSRCRTRWWWWLLIATMVVEKEKRASSLPQSARLPD